MNIKKTILIIEDDLDQQQLYKLILEHAGYSIITRADVPSGLRWLEQVLPDLILLDVMLPGMSGVDMLARIRETNNGREIPIIVATASNLQEKDFSAYKISALLHKPLMPQRLINAIEKALR